MVWNYKKKINSQGITLIIIIAILIFYKTWVLNSFGLKFYDSDEAIMSCGAYDYSRGDFHTPGFYGQSYNPMFESLVAVPFLWMGLKAYIVLPFISSLLSLSPYIILTWLTYRRGLYATSLIILAIPFALPVEYDFITSLSRGWVGGIFVASLAFFSLSGEGSRFKYSWFGFISILAFLIGSGSIFILVPTFIFFAFIHYKESKFWIYLLIGAIPALVIVGLFFSFYLGHPNENLHKIELVISLNNLYKGLSMMVELFKNVTLMMIPPIMLYLVIPVISAIWFIYKRKYPEVLAIIGFLIVFLFSLTMSKVYDGTDSVFYSYSRAFLGLPIVLGLLLSRFELKAVSVYSYLPAILVGFLAYKAYLFPVAIAEAQKSDSVVTVADIDIFLNDSHKLSQLCKEKKVDLVVVNNHWFYDHFTYGSPSIEANFPLTLRPAYERRTWRLKEESKKINKTILLIDRGRDISQDSTLNISAVPNFEGYFIISNNQTNTIDLLKHLQIPIREF